jgi:uncharacterized protein (TIGR03000 family)
VSDPLGAGSPPGRPATDPRFAYPGCRHVRVAATAVEDGAGWYGSGDYGGRGFYGGRGYYPGFFGLGLYGLSWGYPGWGWGYGGYGGYGGYPYYSGYNDDGSYPAYDYYAPTYYPEAIYPSAGQAPIQLTDSDVLLNVRVPVTAKVWVNGEPTTQTGPAREFISSGLTPGRNYTYTIKAEWNEAGRTVDRTMKVPVQGGERRTVDFLTASNAAPALQ